MTNPSRQWAILYDARRLQLLEQGRFWLSDTPDVLGSMTWGQSRHARRHVGAALRHRTFHAFRGDRTGERIDAVLASPEWRVLDAAIVHYAEGGRPLPVRPLPVTATVVLRR